MSRFGLIGKKLTHSFSKHYFTEKFQSLGLEHHYDLIEIEKIEEIRPYLADPEYVGFNITIPYKTEIFTVIQPSEKIKSLGAANVLYRSNEEWQLENTDVIGFQHSLQHWLSIQPNRALILGSGGSSQAVQAVLKRMNILFDIVSRNPQKGLSYDSIQDLSAWQLIIQTTPVGMFPDEDACPLLPYHTLSSLHRVYDLIYNPEKTIFLQKAETQGAYIKNGLEMLYLQADEAWKIWNI